MEHDDDIARAIALSLQAPTNLASHSTDELNDSLFEEQMRQAFEASKVDIVQTEPAATSSMTSKFMSERAQLEKERRERQKRHRKAQGLSDFSDDERKGCNDDDDEDVGEPNAKRQRLSTAPASYTGPNNAGTASSSSRKESPLFWDGEWRPTATSGVEPRKDGRPTFRLSEVLGDKDDIAFAILSTFALELSWIYGLFNPSVPVIMVTQPDPNGSASVKNVLPNWIKTTPFLRGGVGCMHMKFMLIFYKTGRLRVVVSTANLIPYDWRDIENAVWLQDIPPRTKDVALDRTDETSFESMMKRVLDNVNVTPALSVTRKQDHPNLPIRTTGDICTKWDWSNVKVKLVPSIAGRHEEWPKVILTGHTRLMMVLRDLGFRTGKGKKLELEYQGSSIGSYTTQWLNEFYHSAKGESAEDWLDKPKKRREKLPYPTGLKVLYPTLETVRSSQHGERGGGNLFLRRSQWDAPKFPRQIFHDSRSKAGDTLMHTKMIISIVSQTSNTGSSSREVINVDTDSEDEDHQPEFNGGDVGWAYLGSHNFTPSAWGTLSGSAFHPSINIRNHELGIVFPLKSMADANKFACFERPPKKYGPNDSPWISAESIYFGPASSSR
ncbi:tyrosyl-DNA phosphodiesterase-domain-containing protein [Lentinula raphanica]|nr:tyrosyl-DNA phosphodiesterase-domain-containing protein [Lentinula raphanica]